MSREILSLKQGAFCRPLVLCVLAWSFAVGCESSQAPSPEAKQQTAGNKKMSAKEQAALVAARVKAMASASSKAPKAAASQKIDCPKTGLLFSDSELEKEIRKKLGKPNGKLTAKELKKVRSVNLTVGKVDYLDPCIIPKLTGLRHLYIGAGGLSDLSPLRGLVKLEGLRASMNAVSDITPLRNLVKMDQLDLGRTQVRDLSALKGMKLLTELMLDETLVQDIGPLAGLTKLERLSLKRTRVTDISQLKGLANLKFLYVGGAPIDNPYVLGDLMKQGLKVDDKP